MIQSVFFPSIYIGHGAPLNILWKSSYKKNLLNFSNSIDHPNSILVVSAHWERNIPLQITSSQTPPIIYDYYGFPKEMYELSYSCRGNPNLAKKITNLLNSKGWKTEINPNRGLDHGTWIPLKIMYPEPEIPVLQLSIPIPREPLDLFNIGKTLSSFRSEGVMFIGSGNLVHNLPYVFHQIRNGKTNLSPNEPIEAWAEETDNWIKNKLETKQYKYLLSSPDTAPNFKMAAPTTEHFDPLYFILGTLQNNENINHFHEGFEAGSISMRCFSSEA